MENIKVSVIIPVYNSEMYLKQCLDSVVTQTLKDIEIICVNDGSTDKSNQILRTYADEDNRIRVITKFNQGAAVARNEGLMSAGGEFVIFLDSDDYYPSDDVLEKLYRIAKKYGVKAVGGEFAEIDQQGNIRQGNDFTDNSLKGYIFDKEKVIEYKDYQFDFGYTRFVFDRKMLIDNKIFFPKLKFFEDPPFFVRALNCATSFAAIPNQTYIYRIGHKQYKWNEDNISDLFKGLLMNLKFAKENQYQRLYELTVYRMLNNFRQPLERYKIGAEQMQLIVTNNKNLFDKATNRAAIELFMPARGKEVFSISYRVGCIITFIPRWIVHRFDKNKKCL